MCVPCWPFHLAGTMQGNCSIKRRAEASLALAQWQTRLQPLEHSYVCVSSSGRPTRTAHHICIYTHAECVERKERKKEERAGDRFSYWHSFVGQIWAFVSSFVLVKQDSKTRERWPSRPPSSAPCSATPYMNSSSQPETLFLAHKGASLWETTQRMSQTHRKKKRKGFVPGKQWSK